MIKKIYDFIQQRGVQSSLVFLTLIMISVTLINCGGEDKDPEPVTAVQLEKLSYTWTLESITREGEDKLTEYADFTLSLSGSDQAEIYSYTTSGRPSLSPWPATGAWKFGSDPKHDLIRDPGTNELAMNYQLTDESLIITFTFGGAGYEARTKSVTGDWELTFTRN